VHWADPSTLELLGLFIEQVPTVPMLHVLAFRPEFVPPWLTQSHITPITLNRLERTHIEALVRRLVGGKRLPTEVETHIVTKTDGVPLYVEELTKMLLESELLKEDAEHYVLTGSLSNASIPATLQDSLMARLDRLPEVREVAQIGSVLGREFDYEMLQALTEMDEPILQSGLSQLVSHELLYQRGRMPRAKFIFRHVLIRDAAYQSLLRRTRQRYHQRIGEVLEAHFVERVETQPELLAYHYTEAGLNEQALAYWQRAGQRANDHSAYQEALSHSTTGLTLLQTMPETLERHQQELPLQIAFGTASLIIKGHAAPEVEASYTRARVLCQELGNTQDVLRVLLGLWRFYAVRANVPLAQQLGDELLGLAERRDEAPLYVLAHYVVGVTYFQRGELVPARSHLEEGVACDTPTQRNAPLFRTGQDPGVACRAFAAFPLWLLGYPDQALERAKDALALATELDDPFTTVFALDNAAITWQFRREAQAVYDHTDVAVTLSTEQEFPHWVAWGAILRGWALTTQGQCEEGLTEMRRGLTGWRDAGAEAFASHFLALLAEGYGYLDQVEEGLNALNEAIEVIERTGERWYEPEVHRLKGQLLLQQSDDNAIEAESCFQQALDVARHQQAKSLELRAATSLARLWQSQDKRQDATDLLAPVYGWFTEGFDTADLQEAKALLDELSEGR